jgi:hypothetical protein
MKKLLRRLPFRVFMLIRIWRDRMQFAGSKTAIEPLGATAQKLPTRRLMKLHIRGIELFTPSELIEVSGVYWAFSTMEQLCNDGPRTSEATKTMREGDMLAGMTQERESFKKYIRYYLLSVR